MCGRQCSFHVSMVFSASMRIRKHCHSRPGIMLERRHELNNSCLLSSYPSVGDLKVASQPKLQARGQDYQQQSVATGVATGICRCFRQGFQQSLATRTCRAVPGNDETWMPKATYAITEHCSAHSGVIPDLLLTHDPSRFRVYAERQSTGKS